MKLSAIMISQSLNSEEHFRSESMKNVGIIGLGNMGMGMAKKLLKNGYPLTAYDIREESLQEIVKAGAQIAPFVPRKITGPLSKS